MFQQNFAKKKDEEKHITNGETEISCGDFIHFVQNHVYFDK